MILDQLRQIMKGDVSVDVADLEKHSRDTSVFKVMPKAVVYPKDSEDIQKLVGWVSENKDSHQDLSLTARSAGSDMSGGPLNESIILDFMKYMNHLHEVGDDYAITEPGVYYRDFERETLKKGLLFASYPASRQLCAMGGIVANNAGGEKSLRYGKTEKYVQELNVVLSDGKEYVFGPLNKEQLEQKKTQQDFEGEIYRSMSNLIELNKDEIIKAKPNVSKNSAGYYLWNVWDGETFDLTKLFTGSQGTLGIVTKIKLGLIKPKSNTAMLVMFLGDIKSLGEIVNDVLEHNPETFESYDDKTFSVAMKFLPQLLKQMGGNIFSLGFKFLPELKMLLTGGVPKMVLIVEFTGDDESEVIERTKKARDSVSKKFNLRTHVVTKRSEAEKYWVVRRESFNLMRKHAGSKHTAPFIDDVIVRPEKLPEFLPRLSEMVGQYKGLLYTIAGHAGDGNFHVIPIMDFHVPENREAILGLSDKVYDLVAEMGGSITAEHNDGIIRTPYLSKMFSPRMIEIFEETKKIFDSKNIFNPGKKVGGSKEYMMAHVIKE